jgi:glucose/arabinose dehydrogenase
MKKTMFILLLVGFVAIANQSCARDGDGKEKKTKLATVKPDADNAGLKLPSGFGALVVANGLGEARHIAVTPQGDVYVKLSNKVKGKTIYYLHDNDGDGKADVKIGFGDYIGTGMFIKNGYLYTSSNEEVFRYKLDANNKVIDSVHPEKIVTGLLERHEHEAKAITLDDDGNIYVNIGAYSNACQEKDRTKGSPAMNPCPILDSAGGIWQFKADKPNQQYGDGVRYATGLRNVVGLDWNTSTNSLFVMQHGRDQLHDLFPDNYTTQQSAELPAECMYELHKGSNCGWPYIYYDPFKKKIMQGPEYGGDGNKVSDKGFQEPVVAFPAHFAPNGLLFYTGNMFPEKYKNGAFIAFHGSWNRAPEPQKGYLIAFVPFKDGKPSGDWEIFAEGFAGGDTFMSPGKAKHRPVGLAQGPDGSLYVSDDSGGTIYRIVYNGK